ncbi:MAG: 2-hydroxyglutaryl-CoA dehydratase subunit D [Promethearchaeota archaeon CR_4]|nr:MAG: 2-hydroxyglutaryl-CoA dehydratase subunit D [Candidatus Lokiarchaeota archaeon CR_4]
MSEVVTAKKKGQMVVGTFCLYVPDEIILALDGISIGLCGGTNFSNYAAEGLLPVNVCPLIKSALGFGLGKICPYYLATDFLIGETTCDGKKKAWEILGKTKETYVVELPQCKDRPQARAHFIAELKALAKKLEAASGKKLTPENLEKAIAKIAKKRDLLRKVHETRKADPVPISGKDGLLVSQVAFYDDPDRQIEMLGKLAEELEQRVKVGEGVMPKRTKRILVSGTPMAIPNWKLHDTIETSGAAVVAEETCTGTRYFQGEVKATGETVDALLENIADRYLGINCACFTPNEGRLEDIKRLVKEYKVDGVVLYTLSFCQTYDIEAQMLEKALKQAHIPVITITTDYASEDSAQLKTRVEAFIETL